MLKLMLIDVVLLVIFDFLGCIEYSYVFGRRFGLVVVVDVSFQVTTVVVTLILSVMTIIIFIIRRFLFTFSLRQ